MDPDDLLEELYRRPGFLIRRAHQISTSIFLQATGRLGVTATQYGVLVLLSCRPDIDQITVARLLGLDRSTTSMVVKAMEADGLILRKSDKQDRRRRTLALTAEGRDLLSQLESPAAAAAETLLGPLGPSEQTMLLNLLIKLTRQLNDVSRVPVLSR